jgi:FkbM family methyltransferase
MTEHLPLTHRVPLGSTRQSAEAFLSANSRREAAKLLIRKVLLRANLGIGRDPMLARLTRTLSNVGIDTVLDVGANRGQYAALLRAAGFRGTIHSFEPLKGAFKELALRAKRDSAWFAYPYALGEEQSKSTINVSANSYSSSILEMTTEHLEAAPESGVECQQSIDIECLNTIGSRLQLDPGRALLKIDTQGYEARVLAGASEYIERLAAIQLELSLEVLYEGQVLFEELYELMTTEGFALISLEPGIANRWGRTLQFDGVFLRRALFPS